MTEIRRPELTPQRVTSLYLSYLACQDSVMIEGVPLSARFEDVVTAAMELEERWRAAGRRGFASMAYAMLCDAAYITGTGQPADNPAEVGPEYISTQVQYFIDGKDYSGAYRDVVASMKFHMDRPHLSLSELPLLIDRPVILTMCQGEAAKGVLGSLAAGRPVRLPKLLGKGLGPAFYSEPDNHARRTFYHR